jgi:hypothetical protein
LNRDGALKINDNALVALALQVAQSDPSVDKGADDSAYYESD